MWATPTWNLVVLIWDGQLDFSVEVVFGLTFLYADVLACCVRDVHHWQYFWWAMQHNHCTRCCSYQGQVAELVARAAHSNGDIIRVLRTYYGKQFHYILISGPMLTVFCARVAVQMQSNKYYMFCFNQLEWAFGDTTQNRYRAILKSRLC